LRQALQDKAAGLAHISFLGRQDSEAIAQLMQRARFLVFPSVWYEGLPLTILEAYSCKLPVIASNLGVMGEIVLDGVTGLHFQAGNPEDLASKIQWAITHPESLETMGTAAYQTYQTCYTPEVNYHQLLHIYESIRS
jgi:glycosyltransferase involved in cell wall biosynthesis